MRPGTAFRFRRDNTSGFARFDTPEQPSHVGSQISHGLKSFFILLDILRSTTMDHIPVSRGYHRHLRDSEILLQYIQRSGSPGPAGRSDSRCGLMDKSVLSGVKDTVQHGQDAAAGMGVIDRGAEDKAVCFPGLFYHTVDDIVVEYTAARLFSAGAASSAVPHRISAEKQDLRLDAVTLQSLRNLPQRSVRAAVRMRTAVEKQNFHGDHPFQPFLPA